MRLRCQLVYELAWAGVWDFLSPSLFAWLCSLSSDFNRQQCSHTIALLQLTGRGESLIHNSSFHCVTLFSQLSSPSCPDKITQKWLPFLFSCKEDTFLHELHPVPLGAPPYCGSCPMNWPELLSAHQNNLSASRARLHFQKKVFIYFKLRTFKRLFRV